MMRLTVLFCTLFATLSLSATVPDCFTGRSEKEKGQFLLSMNDSTHMDAATVLAMLEKLSLSPNLKATEFPMFVRGQVFVTVRSVDTGFGRHQLDAGLLRARVETQLEELATSGVGVKCRMFPQATPTTPTPRLPTHV